MRTQTKIMGHTENELIASDESYMRIATDEADENKFNKMFCLCLILGFHSFNDINELI